MIVGSGVDERREKASWLIMWLDTATLAVTWAFGDPGGAESDAEVRADEVWHLTTPSEMEGRRRRLGGDEYGFGDNAAVMDARRSEMLAPKGPNECTMGSFSSSGSFSGSLRSDEKELVTSVI